ncbi:MAG: TlpA disulfide reductase family protein [Gammaproteobacteria bacterium]|jgi:peroxiredoxin
MKKTAAAITISIIISALTTIPVTANAGISKKQTIDAVRVIKRAPNFSLHDTNDKVRKLSDFRGHVVAVNFWATWCPPCRKELPSMQKTYKALKKTGFRIVGVNVGEKWDTVATFLDNFSLSYPIVLDTDSTAMQKWHIVGLPTTFIVDKQGRIIYRITGGRNWNDPAFRKKLEMIIKQDK